MHDDFELYGETLAQSSFGVACACGDSATLCVLTMSADLLRERGLKALSQASVTLRRGSVIVSVKNVPASLQDDAVSELEKTEFRDEVELAMGCAEKGAWGRVVPRGTVRMKTGPDGRTWAQGSCSA
jgi:hypothetical protein